MKRLVQSHEKFLSAILSVDTKRYLKFVTFRLFFKKSKFFFKFVYFFFNIHMDSEKSTNSYNTKKRKGNLLENDFLINLLISF